MEGRRHDVEVGGERVLKKRGDGNSKQVNGNSVDMSR